MSNDNDAPAKLASYVDPDAFAEFAGDNYHSITAKINRQNAEGLFSLGCTRLAHHIVINVGVRPDGVTLGAVSVSSRLDLPDEIVLKHALAVIVQRLTGGKEGMLDPLAKPDEEGN
jgi:hypothetical protein